MKIIVVDMKDGTVKVIIPAPQFLADKAIELWGKDGKPGQSAHDGALDAVIEDSVKTYSQCRYDEESDAALATRFRIDISEIDDKLPHRITDTTNIPDDHYFREAWTDDMPGDLVDVDMVKATPIHMDRIGFATDARLKELEQVIFGSEYDAERQKLRAIIPQDFDLSGATTAEELKSLWPEGLPAPE